MSKAELHKEIMSAFSGADKPVRFTEHGSESGECEDVNRQFVKLANKLQSGSVIVMHPGPDLLYLGCCGLQYFFPYLSTYVLECVDEGRGDLAVDLVGSYLMSIIEKDSSCLSATQLDLIKRFSLACLELFHEEFLDYCVEVEELKSLKEQWRKYA